MSMLARLFVFTLAILLFGPLAARAADERDARTIRVMTYNVDEGTDFQELAAAHSPAEFIAAVGTTYMNILATRPAERAAAMAREIAREHPANRERLRDDRAIEPAPASTWRARQARATI
jgi:hypothetical protein